MSSLANRRKQFYSRIAVRVGSPSAEKRKIVYVCLNTKKYSFAKKRNAVVNREENKIRQDIKKGYATKSDLLNINQLVEFEWLKDNGVTSLKIHTLSEYVDKFLSYKTTKKMRPSTIDSYRYALNKMIDSIGSKMLVSDIRQDHIDDLIRFLQDKELSPSSIDSTLKGVSVFLKWCEVRGYLEKTPIIEYFRPIIDDKWLTESEYNAILNFEYKPISNNYHSNLSKNYKRYAKVFKLYAETGMRLSEGFYGILTEDENGIWLAIPNEHSKSKKGRTIELNEEQRDTIIMMQRLWYENDCKKLHIKYYSRMFRKVCDKLEIPKNKSFHSLRHMFGKRMVTITGNIYKVSGLMGHSSVKVTEDSYVKGFDRKSTLRDFPSLKQYLITPQNRQNTGVGTPKWEQHLVGIDNRSSLNYE